MCLPNIQIVYIWETRNLAAFLQCLLESIQPQHSLNVFRFGKRCWRLKPGLVIRLLLIADIWLLICDRLLTVTIYQASTFCAHVPSAELLSLAEPYASFLGEVPLLFGWLWFFKKFYSRCYAKHIILAKLTINRQYTMLIPLSGCPMKHDIQFPCNWYFSITHTE